MTPPSPAPSPARAEAKIPKRERTRKKLITAARDLVYQKGAESIAIQEVTEAAGLATGSFYNYCLLYTSPSPRDGLLSRMPSSA